jgi:hypothetical protein
MSHAQISATQFTTEQRLVAYHLANAVDGAIKAQIIQAVPEYTIAGQKDDLIGFGAVTAQELLTHLVTTYGGITEDDMADNIEAAQEPWDQDTTMESMIARINECAAFASAGEDEFSDAQKIRFFLKALEKSGVMDEALKDWRKKATGDRTWANLPAFFISANKERLRANKITASRIQQANAVNETKEAATTKTSKKITKLDSAPKHYCWTHGLGRNPNHTSATCTAPAEGHVQDATVENMQGGNDRIQRSRGEKQVFKPPQRRNNRSNLARENRREVPRNDTPHNSDEEEE